MSAFEDIVIGKSSIPSLYQRGLLPLWAVEVWTAVWTAVVVLIAVKLYGKMSLKCVKKVEISESGSL